MYALYRKVADTCDDGGKVNIIAVSKSKKKLMELLPHEVEAWLRRTNSDAKNFPELFETQLFRLYLPHGYRPLEYWAREAFDATRFEIVKVCEIS